MAASEGVSPSATKKEVIIMQYNIHNEKYKLADVGGIHREQFREYSDTSKYKNAVDPERTTNNMYFSMSDNGADWSARIKEAKKNSQEITGKKLRKDAVVLCSTVESVPESWSDEVCKSYFKDKAEWFNNFLQTRAGIDEGTMLSVCIHMDETTPHATYAWLPVKDGKFQAKNIVNSTMLKALQTESQLFTMDWIDNYNLCHEKAIEKLDLAVPGSQKQHLSEAAYKEKKMEEHVEALTLQRDEVEKEITGMCQTIAITKNMIEKEKSELNVRQNAVNMLEKKVNTEAAIIADLVNAPNLKKYTDIKNENAELQKELSAKEQIIKNIENELEHWKQTAERWKAQFEKIANAVGKRIMNAIGLGQEARTKDLAESPNRKVIIAIDEMKMEANAMDIKSIRIIPDRENVGQYVAVKKARDGNYERVKDGFKNREEAEGWKKRFGELKTNFAEKEKKELKM